MEIGEVIKSLIEQRCLTQVLVAKSIGKTPTALSQIIKGAYNPSPATLEKLAKVLDVPVVVFHLLSLTEDKVPEENLNLFRKMHPEMEQYLLDVFTSKS